MPTRDTPAATQAQALSDAAAIKTPRPMLPWLLLPLAVITMALMLAEKQVWINSGISIWLVMLAALALGTSATVTYALRKTGVAVAQMMLVVFLVAYVLGSCYWQSLARHGDWLAGTAPQQITCRVISDPSFGSNTATSIVAFELGGSSTQPPPTPTADPPTPTLPPGRHSVRLRVFWPAGTQPPAYGSEVVLTGRIVALQDYQEFLFRQGVAASFTVKTCTNNGFANSLFGAVAGFRNTNQRLLVRNNLPAEHLLAGVLLGNSSELQQTPVGQAFRITGLTHLVAVSGSHLAVIASLLTTALRKLSLKTKTEVALTVVLVTLYVILTAMQPSAIRSAVMLAITQTSRLFGRRSHIPSALCCTACVMLVCQPATAYSLGFWLSVFAVGGMAVFQPYIKAWLYSLLSLDEPAFVSQSSATPNRFKRRLTRLVKKHCVDPLAVSLTAGWATLPLTAPVFACISLVAVPANLLVGPLVTVLLTAGIPIMFLGLLLPPVQSVALSGLLVVANLACKLAQLMAGLPFAAMSVDVDIRLCLVVAFVVAAGLYLKWVLPSPRSKRWLIRTGVALVLLMVAFQLRPIPAELIMLDIGQGDAILIREGGVSVLIDTGPSDGALLRALSRNLVGRIDTVILSHLDSDHCAALDALAFAAHPRNVYFAEGLLSSQPTDKTILTAGQLVTPGGVGELHYRDELIISEHLSLIVLLPQSAVSKGDNDDSLVLCLSYDAEPDGQIDVRVLLTGDAERDVLHQLVYEYPDLCFDVLKVAHHGSRRAVDAGLLQNWHCQIALISCGVNNRYGHPTNDALDTLSEAGVYILRTDELGDIRLRFTPDGVRIGYSGMNPFWSH